MMTIAIRTSYDIFCCQNKEWENRIRILKHYAIVRIFAHIFLGVFLQVYKCGPDFIY